MATGTLTRALLNGSAFYPTLAGGMDIGWSEPLGGFAVTVHAGTLGCVVQRRSDGARQRLTANHVASLGVEVSQPAPTKPQSSVIGTVVAADPALDCSVIAPNGTRGNPAANALQIGPVRGSTTFQLWGPAPLKRRRTTVARFTY